MRHQALPSHTRLLVGRIVVPLVALAGASSGASGAERMVLGEYFTWLNCPSCIIAGPQVSNMINLYGIDGTDPQRSGTFAVVEYHLWDAYEEPWCVNRQYFYNSIFLGTPCFVYDGLWDAWPIETYLSKFLARQSVPTPVTMSIGAEETTANRYEITVEACLEPDAEAVDLRIYTIMAEDHYPAIPNYSRNTFRAGAPTVDISLAPGQCEIVTSTILVIPVTEQSNLRAIAWAQEPYSHWPADVYQAAMAAWPFEPLYPCPWDCGDGDGEVGIFDFLMLLAGWGNAGPCDLDGDGVGITDFLDLLSHWGLCP